MNDTTKQGNHGSKDFSKVPARLTVQMPERLLHEAVLGSMRISPGNATIS